MEFLLIEGRVQVAGGTVHVKAAQIEGLFTAKRRTPGRTTSIEVETMRRTRPNAGLAVAAYNSVACDLQLLLADFLLPTPTTAMKKKPASVHTIGYEQTDFARFAERLAAAGIDLILDVRAVPISRKPGFSKQRLAASLATVQVEYRHIVRLGAPRELRDGLRASGDWSRYERGYFEHLDGLAAEVQGLLDLAAERTICLLCFERDPSVCHRSLITRRMAEKQPGLVIEHIRY